MLDNWDEDKCWVAFEFTSKDEMIEEFRKAMKERCENALQDYKLASGSLNLLEIKKKEI